MDSCNLLKKKILNESSSCESIFEMIFKDSPDGYIYKDNAFKYKYANKSFCKIFEIANLSEFIGKDEIDTFSSENKKIIKEVNNNVAKNHTSINYILNFKGRQEEKILNITTSPIVDDDKFFGIITLIKDITYEEKIKEKFVSKHYQLKSLLENIPLIIFMQDNSLKFLTGTKPSKKFVEDGYDALNNIFLDMGQSRVENDNESLLVLNTNKSISVERRFFDVKGVPHWYKISKFPMRNFKNEVNGLITFAENIDSAKQLQNQRETFVATLGHDLKNPTLAQIRGLELLLKGNFGELNYNQKEILEMILDSCRYMNGMLASLLTTYRNLDGVITLHYEEFSFPDLVAECVSEMIYVANDKNIKIVINPEVQNEIISADRVQLKRVIMNLLSNGIKYAFKDSKLCLKISVINNLAGFEFENKSPYIPKDKQKTLFAQYVTYASNYNELGIGLGLYASQKIIESHQGKIYLESYEDDVNKFGFRIPVNPKPELTENNVCF